jgi:hypothetical protein
MRVSGDRAVEWVDDEAVVLDPATGELHYLNRSAALIYALILEHGYERGMKEAATMFEGDSGFGEGSAVLVAEMVERGLLIDD